jgi:DNA polymerase I
MATKVLLVDAYATIYRAFFAIRSLTGPRGEPVNAIYGFTKMLRKLLADHRPSHCAVVFDRGAPRHRLTILPSYKEQRPPTPPELDAQLPCIRGVLAALRILIMEIDGEEADDIIATLAVQSVKAGADVFIASHDKDFMQVVGPRVRLIRTNGKETVLIDEAGVERRYGVKPEQMVDFLSLVGDPVDNIRGVVGVGEKTAAELLRKYKTVENLLASVLQIEKPRLREALHASADRLCANRQLIALRSDLTLSVTLDDLKVQAPDYTELSALFRQFGFKSLLAEVEEETTRTPDLFARS